MNFQSLFLALQEDLNTGLMKLLAFVCAAVEQGHGVLCIYTQVCRAQGHEI